MRQLQNYQTKIARQPAYAVVKPRLQGSSGNAQSSPSQSVQTAEPISLASLDVNLHPQGVKYLFTTPRGDVQVVARAVSGNLLGRAVRLLVVALAVWIFFVVRRRCAAAARAASAR